MECLISVVVPSYNTKVELIEQCIRSIVCQIPDRAEIIIVDDGSRESYGINLDKLGTIDSHIRVIHQENKGEGGARNTGLKNSAGKYVMFVDADDAVGPGWISRSIELAEECRADIVCGRLCTCRAIPLQTEYKEEKFKVYTDEDVAIIQQNQLLERTDLLTGLKFIDMGVCSKLYRRSLIIDESFPEGVVLSADQVFNHIILKKSKVFVLSNKLSYYYVTNPNSISHIYHEDAVDVMMHSMDLVRQSLYETNDVHQAYYYHCIRDLERGIEFACFNNPKRQSIFKRIALVRNAFNNPTAIVAREKINLSTILKNKNSLFCILVKQGIAIAYVLLYDAKRNMKRIYNQFP